MNVVISPLKKPPMDEFDTEIVERKGLGHPDYISDAASEVASRALCKYYLK